MKVDNKKIIRTLTWRNLKANRPRNLVAVAAIVLTATLFTTIFAVGGNMLKSMQDATMRQVGTSSHAGLKYLTRQQYDDFAASPRIKDISYSIILGTADNDALQKKQHEIRYAEDDWARWGFSYPTAGGMPEKPNELACSTITLDALGLPYELGQTIPLEFTVHGSHYREDFTLSGYWPGDDIMMATQVFLSRAYVESLAPTPQQVDYGLGFDAIVGTINADVWFSNSFDITGKVDRLVADAGYSPGEIEVGVNWAYVGGDVDPITLIMVAALALIIMVSGYLIIYSIFTISVTGDIRFYGLLKTIGATGKQLRRMVRGQALFLSLLGIPVGLLLGFLLGWVLTPYITGITSLGAMHSLSVDPLIFIFAALFSMATVFISCRKPGRIAARVAPVEAVRYTDAGGKQRRKQKKTKPVHPFTMALANVKRNPKKLLVVVASLSLSLVLMNSVYSIVQGFDMDEYLKDQMATDFAVADHSLYNAMTVESNFEGVDGGVLEGIDALPGLESTGNIYFAENYRHKLPEDIFSAFLPTLDGLQPRIVEGWASAADGLDEIRETREVSLHVYGLGGLALETVAAEQGLDAEKLASGDYAFISYIDVDYNDEYPPLYTIGDRIPLQNSEGETREFTVAGYVAYPYIFSCMHSHLISSDVVLAEDTYLDFYGARQPMMTVFNVAQASIESTETWLAGYCETSDPDLTYRSRDFYRGEFENMQTTYLVCGGALAGILMLIGILNFVNTSFTSIYARRRELAMLQSVGMTGKQLRGMLVYEGGLHAALTLLFAATAGSALSYLIIQAMAGSLWFFRWHFTLMPLALSILPLLLVCVLVPVVCYHFMQKESVVERLRQE